MDVMNTNSDQSRRFVDRVQAVMHAPAWDERDIAFAAAMLVLIEQIDLVEDWKQAYETLKGRLQREQRRN